MAYIEPAPLMDKENPFEAMMSRFRTASQILGLEEEVYNVLKVPTKQVIVSLPVTMDNGSIRVFEGYRVIHSTILGPSKGGHPDGSHCGRVIAGAPRESAPSRRADRQGEGKGYLDHGARLAGFIRAHHSDDASEAPRGAASVAARHA